jgi:hypothetical protein
LWSVFGVLVLRNHCLLRLLQAGFAELLGAEGALGTRYLRDSGNMLSLRLQQGRQGDATLLAAANFGGLCAHAAARASTEPAAERHRKPGASAALCGALGTPLASLAPSC